ncbi:hypothetical protein HNO88_002704 [Novosphingobium chloroacetimidivorans]|uniref:Uncharacterized protein n=1 Tax=Novosphingobium chloroacetimidivorans TaxID=1428314 RepID=A0A7W7KAS4_9SPHN|nr:TorF family putative porin [Novosphingobium chloroacetimidivorans]MBB4859375.1 hypothetical protein [Novosphingobium chloroacetimidivorans]
MRITAGRLLSTAAGAFLAAAPAHAQSTQSAQVAIEAATDWRERGLSWSDGKAALGVSASIPITYDLTVAAEAVTLRESSRHGGADVGITIAPRYALTSGGWTIAAGARGNIFVGRAGMSFGEITGEVAHTIGPAQLVLGADFAPSQKAIGGSNLHLEAQGSLGIPGTALTLYGGLGHTSGSDRERPRAWRLRPGGSYTDHHLGIEHARGPLAVGVRYSDTSIRSREVDRRIAFASGDFGSRVVAYLRLSS